MVSCVSSGSSARCNSFHEQATTLRDKIACSRHSALSSGVTLSCLHLHKVDQFREVKNCLAIVFGQQLQGTVAGSLVLQSCPWKIKIWIHVYYGMFLPLSWNWHATHGDCDYYRLSSIFFFLQNSYPLSKNWSTKSWNCILKQIPEN